MTNKEAIDKLKDRYLGMSCYATIEERKADNADLDIAIEALEKQIPKKPKAFCGGWPYECKCGEFVEFPDKYCGFCGQAIDWSDDE